MSSLLGPGPVPGPWVEYHLPPVMLGDPAQLQRWVERQLRPDLARTWELEHGARPMPDGTELELSVAPLTLDRVTNRLRPAQRGEHHHVVGIVGVLIEPRPSTPVDRPCGGLRPWRLLP